MEQEIKINKEDVYLGDLEGTPWPKANKNGDEYLAGPSYEPLNWNVDTLPDDFTPELLLVRGVAVNLEEASERGKLVFIEGIGGLWFMSLDSPSAVKASTTFLQLTDRRQNG